MARENRPESTEPDPDILAELDAKEDFTEDDLRRLAIEVSKDAPPPEGVALGNHRFYSPKQTAPMSRMFADKKQILGMPPPACFKGLVREATPNSPAAAALYEGKFCGHDEPTMGIFDVVIDGTDVVEIGWVPDPDDEDQEYNIPLVVARAPGGEWHAIFRHQWEEGQATLEGFTREPLTPDELDALTESENRAKGRVSIGFEYPADATSADCVTWLTIDVLFEGEPAPVCIVNARLA